MPNLFSSAIHHVDYDEYHHRLYVTFRGTRRAGSGQAPGRSYVYYGVPKDEYLAMMQSRSPGAYFNDHIKDHYTVRQSASY